ncbi:hypothetical protein ABIC65_000168 [Sphingomonas trueperi]|uniref:hypothetical protein n=1 Tax=Sphingomonas trueperi TaxID=53317 RepID=UPI0033915497
MLFLIGHLYYARSAPSGIPCFRIRASTIFHPASAASTDSSHHGKKGVHHHATTFQSHARRAAMAFVATHIADRQRDRRGLGVEGAERLTG